MTAASEVVDRPLRRVPLVGRLSSTALVFTGLVSTTLIAWLILAYIFSGMGGGTSIVESQRVVSALSSSTAEQGDMEVRAVVATPEYFLVTDRGDELFALDPEENLAIMVDSPEYFDAFDRSSTDLGVDPERYIAVLLTVNVHEGELPGAETWLDGVALSSGDARVAALPAFSVAYRSEHHQTLALQFPKRDADGRELLRDEGELVLVAPDFAAGGDPLSVSWSLPLATTEGGGSIGAGATMGPDLTGFNRI